VLFAQAAFELPSECCAWRLIHNCVFHSVFGILTTRRVMLHVRALYAYEQPTGGFNEAVTQDRCIGNQTTCSKQ